MDDANSLKLIGTIEDPPNLNTAPNGNKYYSFKFIDEDKQEHLCSLWEVQYFSLIKSINLGDKIEIHGNEKNMKNGTKIFNVKKVVDSSFELQRQDMAPEELFNGFDCLGKIREKLSKLYLSMDEASWIVNHFLQDYGIPRSKICFLCRIEMKKKVDEKGKSIDDEREVLNHFTLWHDLVLKTFNLLINQGRITAQELYNARSFQMLKNEKGLNKKAQRKSCELLLDELTHLSVPHEDGGQRYVRKSEIDGLLSKDLMNVTAYEGTLLFILSQDIKKKRIKVPISELLKNV